ncbi:MAG: HRDC domain-containing protein [Opitutaceae bacterium]|nr:HRDC domain-containing protein [Verrucomicrobiales bacterium]
MIATSERLASLAAVLRQADWLAIDTEADSLHSYPEKLCLVQISFEGAHELVDPLAGLDLSPLWQALLGRELIFHAADYDLRLLHRGPGFVPTRIFDTMLAARLVGCREFSLSALVGKYLGITLEKGSQKADWSRRPLTPRMEEYARNDTRHLKPVADLLRAELATKGRLAWHEETCARLIADAIAFSGTDPDEVWRIKGSSRLSRLGLTVLREIWHWREQEARLANRPPFFVLSHDSVIAIASASSTGHPVDPLIPPRMAPQRKRSLADAVARGLAVPSTQQPAIIRTRSRHVSDSEKKRAAELQVRRDKHATELGIDPTLIASRGMLNDLAESWDKNAPRLMPWQRVLLS